MDIDDDEVTALDRLADDGCPCFPLDRTLRGPNLPELFLSLEHGAKKLHAQHRTVIHMTTIGVIMVSILLEPSLHLVDLGFLVLSVLCEVNSE